MIIEARLHKTLRSGRGQFDLQLDLEVAKGEFLAITGPSGSGKTTLLRLLAGLSKPEAGQLQFQQQEWWVHTPQRIFRRPQERAIGIVFQDYALFPHMNVLENLHFALERAADKSIIDELIGTMELETLLTQRPATLSGGQQQRVALARALVRRPALLLLDEPLSALDTDMRQRLQTYIRKVHDNYGLTTILVSHDFNEIYKLADRVVRMEAGRITQQGPPEEVLAPAGGFSRKGKIIKVIIENDQQIALVKVEGQQELVRVLLPET